MTDDAALPPAPGSEGNAVASPTLDDLKAKIQALSDRIRDLKNAGGGDGSKDEIAPLVRELLSLKRSFADSNGGIGVDGKPYEEPLSKSEKKRRAKAEKAAAAAKGKGAVEKGGAAAEEKAGPASASESADPDSKGSKKKAAKKAEAKAKRAAMKAAAKEGGGDGGAAAAVKGAGGSGGAPAKDSGRKVPAGSAPSPAPASGTASAVAASRSPPPPAVPSTRTELRPMEISFNPNVPLRERPVVALTVAVLLNVAPDLTIVSDHTRIGGPAFGMPDGGGGEICGDLAIARYLARTVRVGGGMIEDGTSLLGEGEGEGEGEGGSGGCSPESAAEVEQWVDYALSVSMLSPPERRVRAAGATLNAALAGRTYVCGSRLTLADLALYVALGFPSRFRDSSDAMVILGDDYCPAVRWMNTLSSHPAVREATQLALGISNDAEAAFEPDSEMEPLVEGMNPLQGAYAGSVVTRFPPEPSGYLHVGHAKAVLLNDYYARRYGGRLIVRFDDTNPTKEREEYQRSIIEDLGRLGVKPDAVTYTSDYFGTIRGYAEVMIRDGLAYMDDTPQDRMQKERMDRVESTRRSQTPDDAMKYFKLMCSGDPDGSAWCLRARIDMSSVNGTMRDPVLYRQNTTPHHRSGTTYRAYPTYDLACPIVDSIEGVTHALRTTEYDDRNEQYGWMQRSLRLRRVRVHSFSRVNFVNTVLSKRKLTWFVECGRVTGWDDARFPTVRGVARRGIDIRALREFICSQGASRRVVNMEWSKFWAENKKRIDVYSKRFMAVDKNNHVALTVTNGPEADKFEYVSADCHPKDPSMGRRIVRLSKEVLLEKVDADSLAVGEEFVLMRWGVVKITKVEGGLEGAYLPDGNFKKAKKKFTWIASVPENVPCVLTEFDNLITKASLEEDDDIEDYVNPRTLAETEAIGDAGLRALGEHDIIQLERRGYYRVDRPYVGHDKPLVLYMIPDGKSKPMSGLEGRLKHS